METDAEVEVLENNTRKVLNKKQMAEMRRNGSENKGQGRAHPGVEKCAIKLAELGPRLRLRLTKIEEGVCEGKVLWHEYLEKTKDEMEVMETVWKQRREEKERRKKVQRENVEKKRKEKAARSRGAKVGDAAEDENENDEMSDDEWDSEGLEGNEEMEIEGAANGVTAGS